MLSKKQGIIVKTSIKIAQEGRPSIAFSIRQALDMLQMPSQELGLRLMSEVEKNPLLEWEYPPSFVYLADLSSIQAAKTLYEHLLDQVRERFSSQEERKKAISLIEQLDEKGFLSSYAENSSTDPILSILQTFDPPGIFARNLQECLLLQLAPSSDAYKIIHDCFEDLLNSRFETIKGKTGISDLSMAIQELSRISMRPSDHFQTTVAMTLVPDLSIVKMGKTWIVKTLEEDLPKIHLREDYLTITPSSLEEKRSLKQWIASGKWLLRSLKRRKQILLELGALVVKRQAAYLDQQGPLNALTVRELAEHFNLHESTLSRAISNKYVQTPRGILSFRSLLTLDPQTEIAKQALKKLISTEDKNHPLSDEEIVLRLKQTGLNLARRTVAKYRNALKIGTSAQRKHTRPRNGS